jgi:DNA-binding IclR family transcriptional regulator
VTVGVLEKAIAVLTALRQHGPLGLAELEQVTDIPHTTTHRLALALEKHGFVRRDSTGRFSLGFELIALGRAASDTFPLSELGRPHLTRLRDATRESVQLYVRDGDERRCVVSLQSPHGLRWIVPEGALLPLDSGSGGRVLFDAVSHTRQAGGWRGSTVALSETVEEREPGVASVSAPVLASDGTVIAAVSVSGPVTRMGHHPSDRYGQMVTQCANELAEALARSGL